MVSPKAPGDYNYLALRGPTFGFTCKTQFLLAHTRPSIKLAAHQGNKDSSPHTGNFSLRKCTCLSKLTERKLRDSHARCKTAQGLLYSAFLMDLTPVTGKGVGKYLWSSTAWGTQARGTVQVLCLSKHHVCKEHAMKSAGLGPCPRLVTNESFQGQVA